MQRNKRSSSLIAALVAFTFVAGACGSDSDEEGGGDDTTAPVVSTVTSEAEGGETTVAGGETTVAGSDSTDAGTTETSAEGGTSGSTQGVSDEGEPVKGGTLVYGLDSDTANAWAPYRASYASSGYIPLQAVTDSLFGADTDGQAVPLLAESVEHNEDFTEWTITVREGISFHDGTPLDGAAVKFNIDSCLYSPLTATALSAIDTVTAEGQTVTITTKGGPWVVLPAYFTYGSCGYMLSPTWLGSLPDVPQRTEGTPIYDADLAATPADGDPAQPVGLGAFVFESYTPGNGNSFTAVRNEDYWRGPNGITGEDLPYLDSIEAVVAVDVDSRSNSVRSGDFDSMHTANADTVSQFQDDGELETIASTRFAEVSYIMLNVAEGAETDPDGANAGSPLLVLPCRQALAAAIDLERLKEERGGGISTPANGPFAEGSIGYLEDSGYPAYDIDAAQGYMEECLTEVGSDSIEFSFNTTNDPFNVETNTLIVSMWDEAFGGQVQTSITPVEQGQYIGLALFGTFEAFSWRNHGGADPDQQRLWWQSASSTPIGAQALNFGRFKDDVIDEALTVIKSDPDPATRQAAAEDINRQFGAQVYNLWLTHAVWGIISQPYVNGVEANALPDGEEGIGLAFAGRHQLNQMWCDDGKCE